MKKAPLYLLFAFFGTIIFTSCKKDYTCECTVGVPLFFDTTVQIQISDVKKKQAKIACDNNANAIKVSTGAMLTAAFSGIGTDSLLGGLNIASLISASCDLK
jgi:hypothetical protein